MGELIRKLLRWIIFIVIVVLLILLIVKLANKNKTATKTKKIMDSGVETIKKGTKKIKKETEDENMQEITNTDSVTSTLVVDAPDTGSSAHGILLGIIVVGSGIYYIYRNKKLITD